METVFGPRGDSAILALTASSQTFALGTMAATNQAIRLIALNVSHLAWYLKFGTSGAVTVSRTDGMRLIPGSKEKPVIIPVPSGSTHVAILCEGASGNALISYGGYDNGEFSPLGASQIIAVTPTDQLVALPTLASEAPAIRLVSMASNIEALWIKLGNSGVTGSVTTSMKVFPGSVENPTLVPVTSGETHLSIFCEGVGGDIVLTGGGIENGITFPAPPAPTPMSLGLRDIADISGGDTVVASDLAKILKIASGTGTLAFTAAATLGADWYCYIDNADNTGDVTLNPNGAETIDGLSTWILYSRGTILVQCNGTNFRSILLTPMRKTFTADATFTTPGVGSTITGMAWGPGGGGGRSGAGDGGAGGGGGVCVEFSLALSALAATEAVVIGTGGVGATVDNTAGAAGTSTTFGAFVTAFSGGGGDGINTIPGGGGGGGTTSVGASVSNSATGGAGGSPLGGAGGGTGVNGGDSTFGGAGGGGGNSAAAAGRGGHAVYGGGGGGGGMNGAAAGGAGGNSVYGGGGGGGASDTGTQGAGGTSLYGGNGGAGNNAAVAGGNGVAPGGGGGGSESANAGSGARGEIRLVIS